MKLFIQKFAALITTLVLFFLGIVALHEMCHVMAIRMMGGDAYVSYTPGYIIGGGFAHFITVPDHGLWFVYFSGGFGVFLGCMLLWLWAYLSKTMWDMYVELPCLMIALMQLLYAVEETLIYPNNPELFHQIYWIGYLVGAIAGMAIEYKRLFRWLSTQETITRKELYV